MSFGLTKEEMEEFKIGSAGKYDPKLAQQSFECTKNWTNKIIKKFKNKVMIFRLTL